MEIHGTLALETRTSSRTGNQYQVLVFTSYKGKTLMFFDEKAKAQYLQYLVELYQEKTEEDE